jgi:hypothetical protein
VILLATDAGRTRTSAFISDNVDQQIQDVKDYLDTG